MGWQPPPSSTPPPLQAIFASKRTAGKQLEGGFFRPVSFVLSVVINSLPTSIISVFLFSTILYW